MGRSMLPILMLTTVALSSSDILPILFNKDYIQSYNLDDQNNDNIFSNRYRPSDTNNDIFYNKKASQNYLTLPIIKDITEAMHPDTQTQDVKDLNQSMKKEQNYDDEGFRKEQWHNYPRQLDRLHNSRHKEENTDDKLKSEKDDAESTNGAFDNFTADEMLLDNGESNRNVYDSVVAVNNPFLILRIQLRYLQDDINNNNVYTYSNLLPLESDFNQERKIKENKALSELVEPADNVVKVKREKPIRNSDNEVSEDDLFASENGNLSDRRTVKKRIFSLWSRLQSLSHRGHELHHRRHLHAFYGSPDNNRNGIVTAQTRATFIRPPGSPLRWG